MNSIRRVLGLGAGLAACLAVLGGAISQPAEAQTVVQFSRSIYAAKFLCGEWKGNPVGGFEGPVKPGNYLTAINVHNPHRKPVTFVKKAILLFNGETGEPNFERPVPPGQRLSVNLPPNWGLEIDCPDIRFQLLPGDPPAPVFIKGWVVLETFQRGEDLDVVAAYTSHGFRLNADGTTSPEGFSTAIERIPAKPVTF